MTTKNKKLRASARKIREIQDVLAAGITLSVPSPHGTRRFRAGDLTGEARAEDGWLRTTHLSPDGARYVWVGPATFAELHEQAAHLLAHPDEMAARVAAQAAAAEAFRSR